VEHESEMEMKIGGDYETDEGDYVPEHDLFRVRCSCGWKGAAFYSKEENAMRHWWDHVDRVNTRERMIARLNP